MSLAAMTWKRVTVHEIVAAFLQSETHRLAGVISPAAANRLMPMITSPNINDPMENHARLRLLHLFRRQLIGEIPPDTRWFEVRNLTDNELPELHTIARCGWDAPGKDNNELLRVAARSPRPLSSQPVNWPSPILFGHDEAGPFTIIEGKQPPYRLRFRQITRWARHSRAHRDIPDAVFLAHIRPMRRNRE